MKNISTTSILVGTAALLALPMQSFAHVTLQPDSAPAGQFVGLDVRVPNERDNASTNKVQVQFPDGFAFVSYEPVPGWKASVRRTKLDKPIKAEGETITEQVSQVTWTGQGSQGKIGPGQFQDFGLSVQVPDKPNTKLTFKAIQTYDNGETVRGIGAPDSEEPAPQVTVTAAGEDQHGADGGGDAGATGATAEQTSSSGDSGGDDSETLSIIALIVGGLGLVVGGVAFARGRRA